MPERGEESLIDDMRAAIRADRERAAARLAKPSEARAPAPPPAPPEPPRSLLRRVLGR
jgi:hypothetical protein